MRTLALVLVASVMGAACVGGGGCASQGDKNNGSATGAVHGPRWWETGTVWKAVAVNGHPVQSGAAPTFQVLEGGRAGGSAGLNHWSGPIDEEKLARCWVEMGEVMSTLMGGSPEAMAAETEFLGALKRAKTIDPGAMERGELRMLDEHGVEVLRFVKS